MWKQRIETIIETIFLVVFALILNLLGHRNIISPYPFFATSMLVATAIYVFFGCMLRQFGYPKASIVLSMVAFVVLCICLFYSEHILDFVTFSICMTLVMRRASQSCNCNCQVER